MPVWNAMGSLTDERYSHPVTLLPDNTVLVAAGDEDTGIGSATFPAVAED